MVKSFCKAVKRIFMTSLVTLQLIPGRRAGQEEHKRIIAEPVLPILKESGSGSFKRTSWGAVVGSAAEICAKWTTASQHVISPLMLFPQNWSQGAEIHILEPKFKLVNLRHPVRCVHTGTNSEKV
jgi:hypothetical protein